MDFLELAQLAAVQKLSAVCLVSYGISRINVE